MGVYSDDFRKTQFNKAYVVFMQQLQQVLSTEEKWTKGFYAKNKDGVDVDTHSASACKFCLIGAYKKTFFTTPEGKYGADRACVVDMADTAAELYPTQYSKCQVFVSDEMNRREDLIAFNDHPDTTYGMVMNVINTTLEKFIKATAEMPKE